METKEIVYKDDTVTLEGFAIGLHHKDSPLVILCHGWQGINPFVIDEAKRITGWGYACFALDMYGKGVRGKSKEENAALKKPFMENRKFLATRALKGFEVASSMENIDRRRIAVIGWGFGGTCALDLVRNGADLKGAISIYGHLDSPHPLRSTDAKILALHGYRDPITSQSELRAFEKEMAAAKADWQIHNYGLAMHGFALPTANDPSSGVEYHPQTAKRAQIAARNFLDEILK